jgi:hypothetical protein
MYQSITLYLTGMYKYVLTKNFKQTQNSLGNKALAREH